MEYTYECKFCGASLYPTYGGFSHRGKPAGCAFERVPSYFVRRKQMDQGTIPRPDHIMQFFAYQHLPDALQRISKPFCDLANSIVAADGNNLSLPQNPERTVALRKLLEAKDAAVRAYVAK